MLNADSSITYAVVLETGYGVAGEFGKFVRDQEVEAASVTAIGAFSSALLGYSQGKLLDWDLLALLRDRDRTPARP